MRQILLLGFLVLALAPVQTAVAKKVVPASQAQVQLSFAPLVKRAAPAVVNIYTRRVVEQVVRSPLFDDPFFRRFFGERFGAGNGRRRRQQQNSLGSGVLVSADGMIVTNHHVIAGADEITVALSDRREFEAELMLDDESTDLAVLKIKTEGEKLPFLELRDSDSLEVGDLVLAIGNPFNVGQTVTSGIVSALARTGIGVSDFQFFIQTDAAINPGNSGGPLFNAIGEVIGINRAIRTTSSSSSGEPVNSGIGFAISINIVKRVVPALITDGYYDYPYMGISSISDLSLQSIEALGLDRPTGAYVTSISPDSPAEEAGVRGASNSSNGMPTGGDLIIGIDGVEVFQFDTLLKYLINNKAPGDTVTLTVLRDGQELDIQMTLGKRP